MGLMIVNCFFNMESENIFRTLETIKALKSIGSLKQEGNYITIKKLLFPREIYG